MNLVAYTCTNCSKKSSTTCKSCRAPVKKVQRSERGVLGFVGAVRGRSLWVLLLGPGCGPQDSRDHASGQVRSHSWPGSGAAKVTMVTAIQGIERGRNGCLAGMR